MVPKVSCVELIRVPQSKNSECTKFSVHFLFVLFSVWLVLFVFLNTFESTDDFFKRAVKFYC